MSPRVLAFACLALAVSFPAHAAPAARPAFAAMDVFALEWASEPEIAPDGAQVAYVRRSFDVRTDSSREDYESYRRRSPLSLVGNVTTPTMVVTGEQDYRTPISESEQLYQALRIRGIPTLLVRVPGASHSLDARPSQLISRIAHILAWFGKHDPSSSPPPPAAAPMKKGRHD